MRCGHAINWKEVSIKKTPVDHFIGHISMLYKKVIIRPDITNQNQECLNILCPKQEKAVLIFLDHPRDIFFLSTFFLFAA